MPPVLAFIGKPNCGKTTLIEKLIPALADKGVRVGTIKHHHGEIRMDTPGKDTWRHKQAGARVVLLSSPVGIGLVRDTDEDTPVEELVSRYCQDVDLVIAEGYKWTTLPKIEVYRSTVYDEPMEEPGETLIATVSDIEIRQGIPCFGYDDIDLLVKFILKENHKPVKAMDPSLDITGVILAGGQSSRFGSNKALALLHGKPLIQHVADTVASIFNDCLLVTNTPEQYSFLNIPMIRDRYQDMGPLAGIHAALRHTGKSWIFVVGCDMPAVTPDLIAFLCTFVQEDYEAVIPWLETGAEPLCGLYHLTALEQIELYLKGGESKVKEILEKLAVRKIKEQELLHGTDDLQVFYNVNREQDLDRLSRA